MTSASVDASAGVILLLGGRSEIGLQVAQRLAPGRVVVLAARRSDDLDAEVDLVRRAGAAAVHTVEFDAAALETHESVLASIVTQHGEIGDAVLAFGILGDGSRAETDAAHAVSIITVDFVAQVNVLTQLASLMRGQGHGRLVVFSSIAGVRVRRANYVYGSAKAGLDGFASGLSDALHGSGVRLLLVRPGFVIGRMSAGMDPAPMSSTPPQVADATVRALRKGKSTVAVPRRLSVAFFVMRLVPPFAWRRMPR